MKEQLISKIQTVADTEKFKYDAFFLCGSATGNPNQSLLKACEDYLQSLDNFERNNKAAEKLIAELEAALDAAEASEQAGGAAGNAEYIRSILEDREALFNR